MRRGTSDGYIERINRWLRRENEKDWHYCRMFASGDTLYSYGYHYPLARADRINRVLTIRAPLGKYYSPSTRNHADACASGARHAGWGIRYALEQTANTRHWDGTETVVPGAGFGWLVEDTWRHWRWVSKLWPGTMRRVKRIDERIMDIGTQFVGLEDPRPHFEAALLGWSATWRGDAQHIGNDPHWEFQMGLRALRELERVAGLRQ